MASHLQATGRDQPDGSGHAGAAAAIDLTAFDGRDREQAIERERIRHYFTEFSPSARLGGIRPLQFLEVGGAIAVAALMRVLCNAPFVRVAIWCAVIILAEAAIVVVNRLYQARRPADAELKRWAVAKAAIAACGGGAWSLGQILLHVDGEPLSVIVPSWTIMMFCCGAVWAGAFYVPALFGMIATSTLPAAVWLLSGEGFDRAAGFCILVAVPFFMVIGHQASLRYRAAIVNKIEIALLLECQSAYLERIEQLSAEKTLFFSAASHDLRQPLHAMGLYLALLRDQPRGRANEKERDELIENISQCAFSLDSQFNAILGVSQADEQLEQAEPVAVPLQAMLDRLAVQARPRATADGLRLRIAKTSAWAHVAPDILERALGNLVANALRYTTRGGVLLGARRRGDHVAIYVVDTGVGIAAEHRDAVFRDFYQIGNPGRSRDRGFGLGLGIVRRLCAGMGWRIELVSRPGRGTAFAIIVPAAPSPATVAPREAPQVAGSTTPILHKRSALVVDDDPQALDAMRRMLERWRIDAHCCRTAEEALSVLSEIDGKSWHVLIDYRLGGPQTGLDIAGIISATHGQRALPAIITGDSDDTIETRAQQLGIAVLRKPVQPVRLRALLAR